MMRSLFSGVSGLRAHQEKMDVIGNNIANVNTVGFKAGRVTFSDIYSQTISGATSPDSDTGRGGINAVQVGLGMQVSSVDTITTSGSLESTGTLTDLAINGNGFFIVRSGDSGSYQFTRAGNFTIDSSGNLVTSSGLNVYGWMNYEQNSDGTYEFDTEGDVEAINIYSDEYNNNKRIIAAKATENASFRGSLDSTEEAVGTGVDTIDTTNVDPQFTTTMTVCDDLGNEYEVEVDFFKCYVDDSDASNPVTQWYWSISDSSDIDVDITESDSNGFIMFDSEGNIISDDSSYSVTPEIAFAPDADLGSSEFTVKIDFSGVTMTNDDSSVEAYSVDGYPSGTLEDFTIGSDGIITGVYSNSKQQPLGMIGLATFENPAGLSKSGSNTYVATVNSGDFTNGVMSGDDGSGSLTSGSLEMSNVDLSYEFSQMIITQRGFQANSRIITTADEMLQELVNLKR